MNPDEELPEYDNIQKIKHEQWKAAGAALEDAEQEGQITPEERSSFHQSTIAPQLQRFDAMKQNTAKKQMDQQQQLAMQQHAHQTSMDHEATSFRARNVHDLVGTYTDPLTGKTAHMIENDKGDWGPVEFPEEDSGEEDGGEEGGLDYFPQTGGMEVGATQASPGPWAGYNADTRNMQSLQSSGGQWRQTGMQKFNQATGQWEDYNPQQQQQQGQSQDLFNHGEMQELWKRASDSVRLPRGALRDQVVARTFDHLMNLQAHSKMNKAAWRERSKAMAEHDTRLARAKVEKEEQTKRDKESAAKEKADQHEQTALTSSYRHHLDTINKEHHEANTAAGKAITDDEKAAAAKLQKDYHGSQESKEEEAMNRARREREKITGKKKEPEKQNVGTSAQPQANRTEGPQIKPAPEPQKPEESQEFKSILSQVGMDGNKVKWENASPQQLNRLHELLANPENIGMDREHALGSETKEGMRDTIARHMAARGGPGRVVQPAPQGAPQPAGAPQGPDRIRAALAALPSDASPSQKVVAALGEENLSKFQKDQLQDAHDHWLKITSHSSMPLFRETAKQVGEGGQFVSQKAQELNEAWKHHARKIGALVKNLPREFRESVLGQEPPRRPAE